MFLYKKTSSEIIESLNSNAATGLSDEQVTEKQQKFGYNQFAEEKKTSIFVKFLSNFKDFMIIILMIAGIISFFLGDEIDTILIFAIVIINSVIGTFQELKAEKAIESLKELSAPKTIVIRCNNKIEISSSELVPGDIVVLESGNYVPADGRIIDSFSMKVDESILTGESVSIDKDSSVITEPELALGSQLNMVFSGTIVTYGRGKYVVTAIGMNTEIGKIASLIMSEKEGLTPLQIKLKEIGKLLGILVLGISAVIFFLGIYQHRDVFEMFLSAVSLAVAAIPEGLPSIVTIVLALGVQRLSQKNAVIRKLPAVETLGSSSVICSDKTGTLTQNKMTVVKTYVDKKLFDISSTKESTIDIANKMLIEAIVLCNDSTLENDKLLGDPTETALIRFGYDYGYIKEDLEHIKMRINELPFDSERKMMSTIHQNESKYIMYTKGAFDELVNICPTILINGKIETLTEAILEDLTSKNELLAEKAIRVLAVAYKSIEDLTSANIATESDLTFIGLVGMIDPPRKEVKESIKICINAGIRPVMITGDHKTTALAIAKQLGIFNIGDKYLTGKDLSAMSQDELNKTVDNYSVYARVSPEHKVKIVKAWQSRNKVVAMTGDGVNDAPALKIAEIGVAMGKVGTDVSRNAADMILVDDNFTTIVSAIEEGRTIFSNIRKSIRYLLSCNIGEVVLLIFAMLFNLNVPLLPMHILWVNLVTDSFPALALGLEPSEKNVMKQKPREKNESIFANNLAYKIILEGFFIGVISLGVYAYSLRFGLEVARTMAFMTIVFTQLSHSINVRSNKSILFDKGLTSNKYSLIAIMVSSALQIAIATFSPLQAIFKLSNLNSNQWLIVVLAGLLPLIIIEFKKKFFDKEN